MTKTPWGTTGETAGGAALRPPSMVMSETRAGAAYPNALSFSRNLVRKMCREGWEISTIRLQLDKDGCGEALYSIDTGLQRFHFFVISKHFPASVKIDRAFGVNWDVSAGLCQGEWNEDRERRLRVEIPKQYDGRFDSGVLCFCRGNRSERIFDHVVDQLAEGQQPDVNLLVSVGYLLRSTAFAGNGLFGMRPYATLDDEHPLNATYAVQMLAAYMLRTFTFDLVEIMAQQKCCSAIKLNRKLKRYLGVGNSAGLGLVPFVFNHPMLINRWCQVHEQAFAEALSRNPYENSVAHQFLSLLERACSYFGSENRDGNGVFADYAVLSRDLHATLNKATPILLEGYKSATSWQKILDQTTPKDVHAETTELLLGIVLELYPDIIERSEGCLKVENSCHFEPEMTARALREILRRDYDWVFERHKKEPFDRFWYHPQESPFEPRRGVRNLDPKLECETTMDVPLKVVALDEALQSIDSNVTIAELLVTRPELGAIVIRVQSLRNAPYAELRTNTLTSTFKPFATCRFVLAFYGMEKFDPRMPRSTKGALMQGAPLSDELSSGGKGSWPFPLPPSLEENGKITATAQPLREMEQPEISINDLQLAPGKVDFTGTPPEMLSIFTQEHHKLLLRIVVATGLPLTTAMEIADAALLAAALGQQPLPDLLSFLERYPTSNASFITPLRLSGASLPAFAILPRAIDLAATRAAIQGLGWLKVESVLPSPLLFAAPQAAAARGYIVGVADLISNNVHFAGPGRAGIWLATVEGLTPRWASDKFTPNIASSQTLDDSLRLLTAPSSERVQNVSGSPFYVTCLRTRDPSELVEDQIDRILHNFSTIPELTRKSEELRSLSLEMLCNGVDLPTQTLLSLETASLNALLSSSDEEKIAI